MLGQFITVLRSLVTAISELTQQVKRNTDAMTTQTAALADALAVLKPAIQLVVADEGTKGATIAELQTQLAASQQAEAEARANAATPEQIAEIQADATLLTAALHAVQNTPATATTSGDASAPPVVAADTVPPTEPTTPAEATPPTTDAATPGA